MMEHMARNILAHRHARMGYKYSIAAQPSEGMQRFLGLVFHPTKIERATREEIIQNLHNEEAWGIIHGKQRDWKLRPQEFQKKQLPSKEEHEWEVITRDEDEVVVARNKEDDAITRIKFDNAVGAPTPPAEEEPLKTDDTSTMSVYSEEEESSVRASEEEETQHEEEAEIEPLAEPSQHGRMFPQDIDQFISQHQLLHHKKETIKRTKHEKGKSTRRRRQIPPTLAEMGVACRINKKLYVAMDEKGAFGLVDSGKTRSGTRELVMHITRTSKSKLYEVAPRAGEVMRVKSLIDRNVHYGLNVLFTTQYKYYPPGRDVTTCTVGVPETQWQRIIQPSPQA